MAQPAGLQSRTEALGFVWLTGGDPTKINILSSMNYPPAIAAVIVHERVHVRQGMLRARQSCAENERPAYEAESAFWQQLPNAIPLDDYLQSVARGDVDRLVTQQCGGR